MVFRAHCWHSDACVYVPPVCASQPSDKLVVVANSFRDANLTAKPAAIVKALTEGATGMRAATAATASARVAASTDAIEQQSASCPPRMEPCLATAAPSESETPAVASPPPSPPADGSAEPVEDVNNPAPGPASSPPSAGTSSGVELQAQHVHASVAAHGGAGGGGAAGGAVEPRGVLLEGSILRRVEMGCSQYSVGSSGHSFARESSLGAAIQPGLSVDVARAGQDAGDASAVPGYGTDEGAFQAAGLEGGAKAIALEGGGRAIALVGWAHAMLSMLMALDGHLPPGSEVHVLSEKSLHWRYAPELHLQPWTWPTGAVLTRPVFEISCGTQAGNARC